MLIYRGIAFDDWHKHDEEEAGEWSRWGWSQLCPLCMEKLTGAGAGEGEVEKDGKQWELEGDKRQAICGVKGCTNSPFTFIDFKAEFIEEEAE